jgi:hypothetical protein
MKRRGYVGVFGAGMDCAEWELWAWEGREGSTIVGSGGDDYGRRCWVSLLFIINSNIGLY